MPAESFMSVTSTETVSFSFVRVWATDRVANSYAAFASTTSIPSLDNGGKFDTTNGWLDLSIGRTGRVVPDLLKVLFYGVGSNNDTGTCRLYGLANMECLTGGLLTRSYAPVLLGEYAFTLSQAVGVAGGVVLDTERFADTITAVTDVANVSDSIISPANDTPAQLLIDAKGYQYLFVDVIRGGGSPATSVNALVAGM